MFKDLIEMTKAAGRTVTPKNLLWTTRMDSFTVLALTRAREAARRYHVPGVNRALRLVQMAMFGIEIGKEVQLGEGVYFVHTLGVIIGGDSKIGSRVRFMGNNTVGNAREDGYPVIEDDVTIGAGARILGNVRIGQGATIGANSVVLHDVAPGETVVGAPARAKKKG